MALLSRRVLRALLVSLLLAAPAKAGVGVGDPAPAFSLPTRGGNPVTLEQLRGRIVLVDFWASWCAPCVQALPRLDALARQYAGAPVSVVVISVDQSREAAEGFLSRHLDRPAATIAFDPGSRTFARFGALAMPTVYLIDPKGIVRFIHSGPGTELEELAEGIEDLLPKARDEAAVR